jgi:hypothetical protein
VTRPTPRLAAARALALASLACGGETVELVGVVERTSLELAAPVSEEIVEIRRPLGAHVQAGEAAVRLEANVAGLELVATEARQRAAEATMPRPAQWLGELLPLTHSISLCRAILLRAAPVPELAWGLAVLALMATLGLATATRMVRNELA